MGMPKPWCQTAPIPAEVKTQRQTGSIHSCVHQTRRIKEMLGKWLNMHITMGKYILHLQTFKPPRTPLINKPGRIQFSAFQLEITWHPEVLYNTLSVHGFSPNSTGEILSSSLEDLMWRSGDPGRLWQPDTINNVYCFFYTFRWKRNWNLWLFCVDSFTFSPTFRNPSLFTATIASLIILFGSKRCLEEFWTYILRIASPYIFLQRSASFAAD